jgi:hypothetical protein
MEKIKNYNDNAPFHLPSDSSCWSVFIRLQKRSRGKRKSAGTGKRRCNRDPGG